MFVCNSASAISIYLPSVDSSYVGAKCGFINVGSGSLTINANDSDTIAESSAGGYIKTSQADATIVLQLATDTKWCVLNYVGNWVLDSGIFDLNYISLMLSL